jgi:hypothetical protein
MKTGTLTAPSDGPQTVKGSFAVLLRCPDCLYYFGRLHNQSRNRSNCWSLLVHQINGNIFYHQSVQWYSKLFIAMMSEVAVRAAVNHHIDSR